MNQVAKNKGLLDIAKDCFQFVTNFFEVINVSATHIYHSALELCPTSSIIRKLYYHHRVTPSPTVVIGTSESWACNTAITGKDDYNGPCTWSLCGQFVAAQTKKAVEIRNQLTLELITTLLPTETILRLTGPLAYSPDGRSIACASDTAIIIWDIQTGGVAKEIKRSANNISLVWSLDGRTICTISSKDGTTFTVHTYNVSSGTMSSPGTLRSGHNPHLWTVDESFRVMTTVVRGCFIYIDIFEVGFSLTRIRSFSNPLLPPLSNTEAVSFSPTAYRISSSDDNNLSIFDIRNSRSLLATTGNFNSHRFSPDGSLFAACGESSARVWKYDYGHYTPCGEFQFRCLLFPFLLFSPTLSSVLGCSRDILQVWRLQELPTSLKTRRQQHVVLSRSGTRVATAHNMESTVTTTDILARAPPQFIDTDVAIERLVLTGNVLLVEGLGRLVAWLLTEEGLVDGVIGDRRVGHGDSIWTIPSYSEWTVRVEGQIGVIKPEYGNLRVYRTDTGEVLHPTQAPRGVLDDPGDFYLGRNHLRFHDLSQCNTLLEDKWQTSPATVREGWVKDAEGKHRLWMPVEWRMDWSLEDWRHDVTTQFSRLEGRPVLIKF